MGPEDQRSLNVNVNVSSSHSTLLKFTQSGPRCSGTALLSQADGLLALPHSRFISSVSVHTLQCEDDDNGGC